jgi:chromosome segregation ATPase
MKIRTRWISVFVIGVLATGSVLADSDRKASREREAMRRAQQQVQQMQGQLSTLGEEKDKLTQDLDKATNDLKSTKAHNAQVGRKLAAEQQKREELEKELAATKETLDKTQASLTETTRNLDDTRLKLATTEAQKKELETIKAFRERQISACEDKNKSMYQIGRDLMVRYEQKHCGEVFAEKEPFTGLKRVEMENMMEGYRDKLDEQRVIKAPGE